MKYIEIFKKYIEENYAECRNSAIKIEEDLAKSKAVYHGDPIKTLFIPKIFNEQMKEEFEKCCSTTYRILVKVIKKYQSDAEYRNLFPFSKELEKLILTERHYESVIPICRMDIFFNEDDLTYKFCEINTDGTSAMIENLELDRIFENNTALQNYRKYHDISYMEEHDSWVNTFSDIYDDFSKKTENSNIKSHKPYVAIVDFLEAAYTTDIEEFQRAFEKNGFECEIAEIRDLKYKDGVLYSPEGREIQAIYRRAVTDDIMDHLDDVQDFVEAVKDGAVCCIGNFCTQVAHNKALFNVIRRPETKAILTDEENSFVKEHFPLTGFLNSSDTGTELSLEDVLESKDKWLLKPSNLYGARNIYVGSDCSEEEWRDTINKLKDTGYIFQEYCTQYATPDIDLAADEPQYEDCINMTGLYVYDGRLSGIFSRVGYGKLIAGQYGGRTVPTYIEKL